MTSNQMSIYYYLFKQSDVHGWFSSWPPINVVVTKKRYMQMNTKATKQTISLVLNVHVPNQERISCPNPPKNGRNRTMDHSNNQRTVFPPWMITSPTWEKHQVWISAMSAHKFWQNTLPYRRKIMKVPPHSYGKFTTQLYLDQSSRGYIYIEPQQFWKGSVQLKPSTENAPPPPQPKLNSKETITYMVKEMSRMSVRSSITKILNSGI